MTATVTDADGPFSFRGALALHERYAGAEFSLGGSGGSRAGANYGGFSFNFPLTLAQGRAFVAGEVVQSPDAASSSRYAFVSYPLLGPERLLGPYETQGGRITRPVQSMQMVMHADHTADITMELGPIADVLGVPTIPTEPRATLRIHGVLTVWCTFITGQRSPVMVFGTDDAMFASPFCRSVGIDTGLIGLGRRLGQSIP